MGNDTQPDRNAIADRDPAADAPACDFSYPHFAECLQAVTASCSRGDRIELIHDLDMQTRTVPRIAEMEAKVGISAKYFIRLHAVGYNAFSHANLQLFRRLVGDGHQLGLHFEPSFHCADRVGAALAAEIAILETELDLPVRYVSVHEPARFGGVDERLVPDGVTYYCWNSRYYRGAKYISDSNRRWREGCMCGHIGRHPRLIILTHPVWWYEATSAETY